MSFYFLLMSLLIFSGCAYISQKNYRVDSGESSGIVEVDGVVKCENTPCDIQIRQKNIFVGAYHGIDGYRCEESVHSIAIFPDTKNANQYSQYINIDVCNERKDPVYFDLYKPSENIPRGSFRGPTVKNISYFDVGGMDSFWHNKDDFSLDQRYSSISIGYGNQIYRKDFFLFLGEVYLSKRNPLDTPQYEIGTKVSFHYLEASFIYWLAGISYQRTESNFGVESLNTRLGVGLLINHKTLKEFGRSLGCYMRYCVNIFTYEVGELPYDFYFEWAANLHFRMKEWDSQHLNYGFRWYF